MNATKKHETTRILRYTYTDPERLELGKALAQVHNELGQTNTDFDRVKAEFKSKISAHEAKIQDLSNKVSTGYDMRETKCRWNLDEPKKGKKTLVRLDTAKEEIVEVTEMTDADRQVDLPLSEGAHTGVDKGGNVQVPADKK